jgi:hypothetical protein
VICSRFSVTSVGFVGQTYQGAALRTAKRLPRPSAVTDRRYSER